MSVPSGYYEWCLSQNLDPHHPPDWSPAGHEALRRWKLARFKARLRFRHEQGELALIRAQHGQAYLLHEIRADLADARLPLAGSPWRDCPCHRLMSGGAERYTDELGYIRWPPPTEWSPSRRERRLARETGTVLMDPAIEAWIAEDPFTRMTLKPGMARALANLDSAAPVAAPAGGR